ncbi:MAG: DUF2207 domain-containing protein, partial [Saprospiraceae bacterium]
EYFVINDYKVDIHVFSKEGIFEVTETITVEFSEPRRGIFRKIPFRYSINEEEMEIKIFDSDVPEYNYKTYKEGNDFVIRIGDEDIYVEGVQTYIIKYKVKKAFLFLDERAEFNWNLIGNDWPVEIKNVRYNVQLDPPLAMAEGDYYIYSGMRGEQGKDATVVYYNGTFSGAATRPFQPNEGMTLAINLPLDYITRPGKWELLWEKYGKSGIGGTVFLLISGLFYRTWKKYGKDYPIVRMVQYVPPKDLNPAEAGVIIDEKADTVDILSLLPYWAHNGHITIRRIPKNWGKDDHEITMIKPLPDQAAPYEKIIFDGLFEDTNSVLVSDLENKFYQHLQSAKVSLRTHINSMGIYYPISIKWQVYSIIISVVLAVLGVILGLLFESLAIGLAFGLSSIVGLIFSTFMLKKNELGVRLYQEVLGFKMFIKAAEKDKIEFLLKEDPDYFEKTLPYAMIFGYAKQWSKKFDGLLLEPPKWYVGPPGMFYHGGSFSPADFGESFTSGINDIQSVFTSTPQSSGGGSGGGFGGGGSSGGGFGGGGGGSW